MLHGLLSGVGGRGWPLLRPSLGPAGAAGGPGQLPEQRLPSRPQVAAPAEPWRAALLRRGRLWQVQRRRAGRGREPRGEVRGRVGVRGQCPRPPSTAGPSPPRSRGAARPVPPESLSDSWLPLQMRRAQEPRAQTAAPRSPYSPLEPRSPSRSPEPGGEWARTRRTLAPRPAPPACAARRPPCRSRWCWRPRGQAGPEYPRALSHLWPEGHSRSFAIRDKPACHGGGCRARWPPDPGGGGAGLSLQD